MCQIYTSFTLKMNEIIPHNHEWKTQTAVIQLIFGGGVIYKGNICGELYCRINNIYIGELRNLKSSHQGLKKLLISSWCMSETNSLFLYSLRL